MEDAAGFFANVFGGERFQDYVRLFQSPIYLFSLSTFSFRQIGEISIMKDMTSMATTMMTEEEKAEIEKQLNVGNNNANGGPAAQPSIAAEAHKPAGASSTPTTSSRPISQESKPGRPSTPVTAVEQTATTSAANKAAAEKEREKQELARRKEIGRAHV